MATAGCHRRTAGWALAVFPGIAAITGPVFAVPPAAPAQTQTVPLPEASPAPAETLLGNALGLRPALRESGIEPGLLLQYEYFRNPTGGLRQSGNADGLATMSIDVDLGRAIELEGAHFRVSGFGIFGRGITQSALGSLGTVSSNEAYRALRLWELWIEQTFWSSKGSIRIGQQAADLEFFTSIYASVFLNSAFGWPNLPSNDLPAGGPAFPLATPGVRLRLGDFGGTTVMFGLYSGDPSPPGVLDPEIQDHGGVAFTLNEGALLIGELQRTIRMSETLGLPGTVKLGFWYNTYKFADQRFDARGLSLADAASGQPRQHWGNWSIYGVWDQEVWHGRTGQALSVFVRASAAPRDRNLVDLEVNPGIVAKGIVPGRPDDSLGLGYVFTHVSAAATALDRDRNAASGGLLPVRDAEQTIELTYQAAVRDWLVLQPDLQYWIAPGGRVPDPSRPGRPVADALVIGLRTSVNF